MHQRSVAILNQILKNDGYTTVNELSVLFNVSRRTIYNDLDKINDWLLEHYHAKLEQVRAKGFYVEPELRKTILENQDLPELKYYEFSKEERKAWIYIYLAYRQKAYFLQDFQDLFLVSRNTVIDDIKLVKQELDDHKISLNADIRNGYNIFGEETAIRQCLIQYLSEVMSPEHVSYFLKTDAAVENEQESIIQPHTILVKEDLQEIKAYVNAYENEVEVEITDDVRNELILWFYFFVQRIKLGEIAAVEPAEKEVIHATEEFIGAKDLCASIATYFDVDVPNSEITYFTKYLLSAKVNYDLNLQLESQDMKELTAVVEKMVYDFQKYAAVEFPEQHRMIHNLLLHLKPTFYRKKYGIRIQNILKDSIKNNYPEIFNLTKNVIPHFEALMGQEIDENEIAFIAMHFGGWLRNEGVELEARRKKMLLVCTSGLGTSRLLENQLKGLFSDVDITNVVSLKEYEEMDTLPLVADFIVSTILLPDKGVPVFVVEPILSNHKRMELLNKVSSLYDDAPGQQTMTIGHLLDIIHRHADIKDREALKAELNHYLNASNSFSTPNAASGLLDFLSEDHIQVVKQVENWEEAIIKASSPLVEEKCITEKYIQKMIQVVKDDGPYIVISDQVALPHASSESDVKQTGMSMLFLEDEVDMLGKPVRVFIVLAAVDNEQHLRALSELTRMFSNKEQKDKIMKAQNKMELMEWMQLFIERNAS